MTLIRAQIVVDLGFGDSGKGLVVDSLCEKASRPLVVRYTGGPQAGHTVVRDGKRHVFSSFGSGTLQGVPSFFGPETLIYPPNLWREYKKLKDLNGSVPVTLYIDPRAKVITPADVAIGRVREMVKRHGSCGLGVGTAMRRHETTPLQTPAGALSHHRLFSHKLESVITWAEGEAGAMRSYDWVEDAFREELENNLRDWAECYGSFQSAKGIKIMSLPDAIQAEKAHVLVFEGAQGVMLDRDLGFFPNVTYGNTTSKHAWSILKDLAVPVHTDVTYVHRCYTTRHGAGWMPNEWSQEDVDMKLDSKETKETNVTNQWQGEFRYGDLDLDLIKAAMRYDQSFHAGGCSESFVFTCVDQRPGFHLPVDDVRGWGIFDVKTNSTPESGHIQAV
jgi:adenylosuccinate synthase